MLCSALSLLVHTLNNTLPTPSSEVVSRYGTTGNRVFCIVYVDAKSVGLTAHLDLQRKLHVADDKNKEPKGLPAHGTKVQYDT